jgi:hypothetical protein
MILISDQLLLWDRPRIIVMMMGQRAHQTTAVRGRRAIGAPFRQQRVFT